MREEERRALYSKIRLKYIEGMIEFAKHHLATSILTSILGRFIIDANISG